MILLYAALIAASFGFAYLWHRTAPATGSGWALFASIIIAVCLDAPAAAAVGVPVYLVFAAGFGITWYLWRGREYAGWLLFASVLSGLQLLNYF